MLAIGFGRLGHLDMGELAKTLGLSPCIVHKQRGAGRRPRPPPAALVVAAQALSNSPCQPHVLARHGAPICYEWAELINAQARLFLA